VFHLTPTLIRGEEVRTEQQEENGGREALLLYHLGRIKSRWNLGMTPEGDYALVKQDLEMFLQFLLQLLISISIGAVQCDWCVYDLLIAHGVGLALSFSCSTIMDAIIAILRMLSKRGSALNIFVVPGLLATIL
jgi:hypothetical protein